MKIKIVTDSSANLLGLGEFPFQVAPLKIITDNKEYVDDKNLNVYKMVNELSVYKGKSSTSCPNESDWLNTFEDADIIFCATITGALSGSYNAAKLAKQTYEEKYSNRKVFVLNSLSAGPEITLILQKIKECILSEKTFEETIEITEEYINHTGLLFMLESMKNLANNGRVSPLVAKTAGLLGIRVVGKASQKGELEPISKCRGEDRVITTILNILKCEGLKKGKVRIDHCFNEAAARKLKRQIQNELPCVSVKISECRGLCSFYAEKGGMLVGFEKF